VHTSNDAVNDSYDYGGQLYAGRKTAEEHKPGVVLEVYAGSSPTKLCERYRYGNRPQLSNWHLESISAAE
jgi:hypothetical protein